jgi:multiple sugar transport system ATP-binding protein
MAGVNLERVCKRYGEVEAVREVTLAIPDRELVVLVGPSGCGKSTTLRMVAGLEDISSGEIRIGDRVVNDVAPKDRDIAMVFQSYALYPHMSVRQNLEFGLKMRGAPRREIDERVAEAAAILGIEALLERKPKQLSGGQRQRVAMGRAIVRRPAVFLFDEPLSNLDAKLRVQMRTEISRLHGKLQTTTIYVTHDQVEAMTLADRIVVMKDGVVLQVGAPLELYDRPQNLFVAGFIGTPAMNFLEGELGGREDAPCFVRQGLSLPLDGIGKLAESTWRGRRVTLGARPTDLTLDSQESPGKLSARVGVREPLGSEVYLHLDAPLSGWVVRTDGHSPVQEGELVHLGLRPGAAHLFDQSTGQRATS